MARSCRTKPGRWLGDHSASSSVLPAKCWPAGVSRRRGNCARGIPHSLSRRRHLSPKGEDFEWSVLRRASTAVMHWLALSRQPIREPGTISAMAADLIVLLASARTADEDQLSRLFLGRIRAWQAFMEKEQDRHARSRGRNWPLRRTAAFSRRCSMPACRPPMRSMLGAVPSTACRISCSAPARSKSNRPWQRPDFPPPSGPSSSWTTRVRQPLFLAGVRLALDGTGRTLPELIAELRHLMRDNRYRRRRSTTACSRPAT